MRALLGALASRQVELERASSRFGIPDDRLEATARSVAGRASTVEELPGRSGP